jgi:hypothetical protein
MARRIPQSKSISRKLGKKSPKFLIIAFCEGKNTEPEYLKSFARHHGNSLVDVQTIAPAGAPLTIVQSAVARKKQEDAKKKTNSFDGLYEVWAVFDIDEHPNIPQAINMAKANHVYTAISNPCIEIWFLWHFTFHQSYIHRHDLQRELAKYMASYQSDGSKLIDYKQIKDHYALAKTRAEKQLANHQVTGNPYDNPSTTLYKLLEKIIENGSLTKLPASQIPL